MILSVSTWSAHPLLLDKTMTKEDFVKLISSHGAKGMEVVDIDFEDCSYESMKALQDIGRACGVEITCMSLEHDLCRMDPKARQADVNRVFEWMEISRRLGVKTVRVFTGWEKEGIPYEMQLEWVRDGLSRIARRAEEMDVTLVLENHNSVCLRAKEILAMLDSIGSSKLFTCPDIFNYKKFAGPEIPVIDEECFDEIELLLPLAQNAHFKICEAVGGNTADKYLDVARMLKRLEVHHYDGPVAIEFMWPYMKGNRQLEVELAGAIDVMKYQMEGIYDGKN